MYPHWVIMESFDEVTSALKENADKMPVLINGEI